MLYIFGGLPGTGKSTLASALARRYHAIYIRIDTIEQAIRDCDLCVDGPAGYVVAYKLASENLRLGADVVVDSVNPIEITRQAWREVASHAAASFVEIEITCSNAQEHRLRIETRQSDIPGLKLPSWHEVLERAYEPWHNAHVVLDTAGQPLNESISRLFSALDEWENKS